MALKGKPKSNTVKLCLFYDLDSLYRNFVQDLRKEIKDTSMEISIFRQSSQSQCISHQFSE